MLTVYNCIVNDHDLRLVLLATVICAIASLAAVILLHRLRQARGKMLLAWTAIAATAIGSGIWATHFFAMLAFSPGIPNAYDVGLTIASLSAAIIIAGVGAYVATVRSSIDNQLVGGAIIGAGIAAMHYAGMAAFAVQGRIEWNLLFVAVSIVIGVVLAAAGVFAALRRTSIGIRVLGATLLTLAICGHHFVAMAAISIHPDASIAIPQSAVPGENLVLAVGAANFVILFLVGAAIWLDLREYRRSAREIDRMNGLANAAVEGLLVCDGPRLVTANESFLNLTGWNEGILRGLFLSDLFDDAEVCRALLDGTQEIFESELVLSGNKVVPVDLLSRAVDYRGAPHLVVAVRDIRERKKAEADIHQLAMNDSLTNLPNRRAFTARLDAEIAVAARDGKSVALLCLDLDRFKEVNDLFGHAAGDAMLQKVARCASGVLRNNQMLARLGGDEFAIIAPGLSDEAAAGRIAEDVLRAFHEENGKAACDGLMSTSIGIAIYPDDAGDRETLLSHADTALYRAKSEGRDTFCFYEAEMGREARQRRLMEHELRHAVARNEFHLVYQPQKRLDTGETIGFEALLRWQNGERGNVSPAVFVPVAEESGAIVAIGEWVLTTACREAAGWNTPLMIAVNVSPIQLHSQNFVQTVHQVLFDTGLSPQRLEIEITETALVRDMNRAVATLRQLKGMGVRVAMDDFGTGYSSLSNLRAFPFDKIKIDGSFIRSVDHNEQAATIVKAVLGIGRGLGLPVLAEGVETTGELAFLAGELCQIGQGYLLGRPGPIGGFEELTGAATASAA